MTVVLVTGTTNGSVNTETAHAHGEGIAPLIWIPVLKDKAGDIYQSKASDGVNFYSKSIVASVSFTALCVFVG